MLEAYFFMLFCVPLPVICSGNAAGLAVTALLIIFTVYSDNALKIVGELWHSGNAAVFALLIISAAIIAIMIYLIILSVKMLKAQHNRADFTKPCTVIILGCRVRGTRPTRMLRRRLNTAYEYMQKNPQSVCIVSGGKGADEQISEAQAMKTYLLGLGLEESRIYFEDRSTSTLENLKFSQEIIRSRGLSDNIAVATDGFHQYRASLLARRLGMSVKAISASTEPRYLPTYWVREWFGITLYTIKFIKQS